jgi:hypothetical protein
VLVLVLVLGLVLGSVLFPVVSIMSTSTSTTGNDDAQRFSSQEAGRGVKESRDRDAT